MLVARNNWVGVHCGMNRRLENAPPIKTVLCGPFNPCVIPFRFYYRSRPRGFSSSSLLLLLFLETNRRRIVPRGKHRGSIIVMKVARPVWLIDSTFCPFFEGILVANGIRSFSRTCCRNSALGFRGSSRHYCYYSPALLKGTLVSGCAKNFRELGIPILSWDHLRHVVVILIIIFYCLHQRVVWTSALFRLQGEFW